MGAPEAVIETARRRLDATAAPDDGVWPEHVPTVTAFLTVATQWRTTFIGGGLGGGKLLRLGLDYAGVRAGLDLAGIAPTPALFADLQTMEAAAIAALNAR